MSRDLLSGSSIAKRRYLNRNTTKYSNVGSWLIGTLMPKMTKFVSVASCSTVLFYIILKFYQNPHLTQQLAQKSKSVLRALWKLVWAPQTWRIQRRPTTPTTNSVESSVHDEQKSSEKVNSAIDGRHLRETPQSSCFCHHRRLQQQVLQYWFGQGTPDQSQRQLWMIAAASHQQIAKVDAAISKKFGALLLQLAEAISIGDAKDANATSSCMWNEWCWSETNRNGCGDQHNVYGYQGKLAAIIVLDQFSRHIHRNFQRQSISPLNPERKEPLDLYDTNLDVSDPASSHHQQKRLLATALPNQSSLDTLALRTAQLFLTEHAQEIQTGMIPTPMYIFACMPLRHARTIQLVQEVQQHVSLMDSLVNEYQSMVGRFRKATNRRLAVLQDEARRYGKLSSTVVEKQPLKENGADSQGSEPNGFSDEAILECAAFEADMGPAKHHPVYQTIRSFLQKHVVGILEQTLSVSDSHQQNSPQTLIPIIISLSGGVDSMVIASVLSQLAEEFRLMVVAVHIDYANRPESAAEADFVRRYCDLLEVEFHCRRIDEVTRGVTARDEYEQVARKVRFDMYRQTMKKCLAKLRSDGRLNTVGIVLGHHRGDLRENVLSNAHRGCGPLDLSGMTPVSKNDGVTLFRPLLPLEKHFVFDYAHKFGVPYFKDTTPHWSTRGKLRNKLLPLLEEIYGEGSMNNLSNLAVESDECKALLHEVALRPFLNQVEHKPMGITFATHSWKHYSPFFWKFVLREALHSAGISMFTDKSVLSFLERVKAEKLREGWLQCRKDCACYLREDGRVYVLFPDCFPWQKSSMYKTDGLHVGYGSDNAVEVGPWKVTAQQLPTCAGEIEDEKKLEIKAIPSMDHLMCGVVEYYLEAPTWQSVDGSFAPSPLIFTDFTKRNRPQAWKNTDIKLQEHLPLLGNDSKALDALQNLNWSDAAHIKMNGDIEQNPKVVVQITLQLNREKSKGS